MLVLVKTLFFQLENSNRYTGTHILVYKGNHSRTSRYYYIYIVVMEMICVIINTCLMQNKGVSKFG